MVKIKPRFLTFLSNLTKNALILALIPFGVAMLIIGLLFGVGYWTADSPAARYLLLAAGLGGSGYMFVTVYRAIRQTTYSTRRAEKTTIYRKQKDLVD